MNIAQTVNLNEMKAVSCQVKIVPEGLQMTDRTDGGFVVTPNMYKVPFKLTARAKTNSNELRFRFARGGFILSWSNNPDELRLADPQSGEDYGVPQIGRIPAEEWIVVTWAVDRKRMSISVNDEERYAVEGDYGDLAGHIGIGPAWGSVVTLSSVEVSGDITDKGIPIDAPPRYRWDGGFIYIKYDNHEAAVDWYCNHFGLIKKWDTFAGNQDPESLSEKMTSLEFPGGGLVHLKSFLSNEPLKHFFADWNRQQTEVYFRFTTSDIRNAYNYFVENGISVSEISPSVDGRESFFVEAIEGTRHMLISTSDIQNEPRECSVIGYDRWRVGVTDLHSAIDWYRIHLGLQTEEIDPGQCYALLEGNLMLEHTTTLTDNQPRNGSASPYFNCKDIVDEHQYLQEHNIRHSDIIGNGWQAMHLYDPDGNRLNIWAC